MRVVAAGTALAMLWLSGPAAALAKAPARYVPVSRLKAKGLTDTPDAALRRKIDAQAAAQVKPQADVRVLTQREMSGIDGRGPLRNAGFAGTLPWQRSLHDVNLCNGNLLKSFTDLQVAPERWLYANDMLGQCTSRVPSDGKTWADVYDRAHTMVHGLSGRYHVLAERDVTMTKGASSTGR